MRTARRFRPSLRRTITLHAAAKLAKELRGYAERADQTAEFVAWVGKVRTDNIRRRALQNEFDLAHLPR